MMHKRAENSTYETVLSLIMFRLPLVLSGVFQQLYNWVDAYIVGHFVGEAALAAIGATGAITLCITFAIIGFTSGLSVLAAQQYGKGDIQYVGRLLKSFLHLLLPLSVILSLAAIWRNADLIRWMNTPDDMVALSRDYLRIILTGVPFLVIYNLYAGMLRAMGNSKAPFRAILLSSVINVVLDIILIAVAGYGVTGAAAATVISQIVMTSYVLIYASARYDIFRLPDIFGISRKLPQKDKRGPDWHVLRNGCRFAVPLTIQECIGTFGRVILQSFMNGFGTHTVAAITTAYRLDSLMLLPLLELGTAISTMVAQSHGGGDQRKAEEYFRVGLALCVFNALLLTVIMFFFGGSLIAVFGLRGEALQTGALFFRHICWYYFLCGISTALRSALQGKGRVLYVSAAGILVLIFRIGFSYLLRESLGSMAIAHAEGLSWIFAVCCYMTGDGSLSRIVRDRTKTKQCNGEE